MKLIFTGHDYRYAVEQSLLAFFPGERPVYEGEDPREARVLLRLENQTALASTALSADGRTALGEARADLSGAKDGYERERRKQRAVKLSFFEAARSLTGVTPAWGALTGIRPAKLAAELKEETGCHIGYINLSGGIGVPYRPEEEAVDIARIGQEVRRRYEEILVPAGMGDVQLCSELGRFMMAPYGCLVTRVLHFKHIYKEYAGVDACAADLMRPAVYGAYHHITASGKEDAPCTCRYDVTGSLCENCDKFAVDRELPELQRGDLLIIHDTGAHGHSMGYNYNGKLRSAELLLRADGTVELMRRAETPEDYFATLVW